MSSHARISNLPAARAASPLARLPYFVAATIAAVACIVLIGWQFDLEHLKRIMPTWVAMNPTSAVCFLMASVSLAISARTSQLSPSLLLTARALAFLIAAFGLLKLVDSLGGPDFHLDQLLYNLQTGAPAAADIAVRTNRMAPNTAILFLFCGAALFIARFDRPAPRIVSKAIAVISSLIALVATVGYFNGVDSLYRPTALTPMALHTAINFFLLAAGILSLDLNAGLSTLDSSADHTDLNDLSALRKKMTIGFGAALFLLVLIGVVSYACIQTSAAANRSAERARHILASVSDLSDLVTDAESSERGYVITGQDTLLDPYRQAVAQTSSRVRELQNLAVDDSFQQQQLGDITPLIHRELEFLGQVIDVRRLKGVEPAQQLIATGQGKVRRDAVLTILSTMSEHEQKVQDSRSMQIAQSDNVTTVVITSGILLAFILVGLAGWMIRRDLAQRQRVAEQLRQALLDADEANHAKSRFLANMSHEIRTPMSAIIGYADLVLEPHQSASDRLDYINTIRRNAEHLLTLINDILDLSKVEAGKCEVDRAKCCPCQILSDVASLMRIRAVEKHIALEIRNEGLIPIHIHTDASRLRQILINLIGNAIKFTDHGSVRLIMKLEESPSVGPRLRFDITDTGIGISSDQLARLFQPFTQADASTTRRFGGTGLGLTISKRFAEMLGGGITVDSAPGRGSIFSLTIDPGPLDGIARIANCRESLAGHEPGAAAPVAASLHSRILIVDDGDDNRRLLSVYLRLAGAQVAIAENGRIGVDKALAELAARTPFDVILMDMQMPVLDGYAATALLRSKNYPGTIIALTANAMAEDCDKCLNVGCTDYLSKPVRRERLLATVARYLQSPPLSRGGDNVLSETPPTPLPTDGVPTLDLSTPIRSDLTDESLRSFLITYINELPGRVAELHDCLAQRDLAQLATKIHNLKGTGGLYGLMPITEAAAKAEKLLLDNASLDSIQPFIEDLIETIRRVEGFTPLPSAPPSTRPI